MKGKGRELAAKVIDLVLAASTLKWGFHHGGSLEREFSRFLNCLREIFKFFDRDGAVRVIEKLELKMEHYLWRSSVIGDIDETGLLHALRKYILGYYDDGAFANDVYDNCVWITNVLKEDFASKKINLI